MATLQWDFYRQVNDADEIGGVVHYYDTEAQSLYLNVLGLATTLELIDEGHWSESIPEEEIQITDDEWTRLRWEHPSNSALYGVAIGPNGLEFLRYVYMQDISTLIRSFSWRQNIDSPIASFSADIMNVGEDFFLSDISLFNPSARVDIRVRFGKSEPYPIGVAWLDDIEYDVLSDSVPISGRNTIGKLKDQTFDENTEFTGYSYEQATAMLQLAGIKKFIVQTSSAAGQKPFTFSPSQTILDGIAEVNEYYEASGGNRWTVQELANGTVLYGYEAWVAQNYQANSYYTFDVGKDIFRRKTRKAVDGAYTRVYVTGKDDDGVEHEPIILPVENYEFWDLGPHKTKFITAENNMDAETFAQFAETCAAELQYIGVGEQFTSPFRPQLLCGDIAEVVSGGIANRIGIITEITQSFSAQNGFRTDFSVDSGGVTTTGTQYIVYNRVANVSGYNRKQQIADLIRIIK